jgi:steroid delta-isomerase-like uncharacterized protein
MKTLKIAALSLLFAAFAAVATAQTAAQNKAAALQAIEHLNTRNYDGFASFLADDFTEYAAPEPVKGKMPAVESMKEYVNAFPDMNIKVEKVVAEGNTVMVYVTTTGTWQKDFMGMAATGKSFNITDVDIIEFDGRGKATSHRSVQDPMVMMSQIMK